MRFIQRSPARRRRLLWCLLVVLWFATAPTGWLPMLANAGLREFCRARELPCRVHVVRLTPWNLRLNATLGAPTARTRVDDVDVRFTPLGLAHRRLARVDIQGGMVQVQIASNGVRVCGMPERLPRVSTGMEDETEESAAAPWQVEKLVVDDLFVRVLPPRDTDRPLDLRLHASAVTQGGELHVAMTDQGDSGLQANGVFDALSGDGWLIVTLPENDLKDWLRLAQRQLSDSRWQSPELCIGRGGLTASARFVNWHPMLAQADLAARAASKLPGAALSGDLRLHVFAKWEGEDERPEVNVDADVGVRSAAFGGFFWAGDNGPPASARLALTLSPRSADWQCRIDGQATVSRDAVAALLPPASGMAPIPLRITVDGALDSADLSAWDGDIHARLLAETFHWQRQTLTADAQSVAADATLKITNSIAGAIRGGIDVSGLIARAPGASVAGEIAGAFAGDVAAGLACGALTTRVAQVSLAAGNWEGGLPMTTRFGFKAHDLHSANWLVGIDVTNSQAPWRLTLPAGRLEGSGLDVQPHCFSFPVCTVSPEGLSLNLDASLERFVWLADGMRVEGDAHWTMPSFVGGTGADIVACARVGLRMQAGDDAGGASVAFSHNGRQTEIAITDGWFRQGQGLHVGGVELHVPLVSTNDEWRVAAGPALTWTNLDCKGIHVLPQSFACAGRGQAFTAQLTAGIENTPLALRLGVGVSWSNGVEVAGSLDLPPTLLADTDAMRAATRALAGRELSVTGLVSAHATAQMVPGRAPAMSAVAALSNLDVRGEAGRWAVDGLSAHVALEGGKFWRTPPGQNVSFHHARVKEIEFDGGWMNWQLRRRSLLVEHAQAAWCGGKLDVYGVPIDLDDPRVGFVTYAEKIDIGRMLAQWRLLPGSGAGHLYGRFPIELDHDKIRLSEGFLLSLPGEGGVLRLENDQMIAAALEQANVSPQVRQTLHQALNHMSFSVFRMDLSSDQEQNATLGFKLEGRPADDPTALPVDLQVNLHAPLEQLLNFGVKATRQFR